MGLKALNARQGEPFGNGGALTLVGDQVEPLAVANLVEAQLVGEAVAHAILPCSRRSSGVASSRWAKRRNAAALCSTASLATSPL